MQPDAATLLPAKRAHYLLQSGCYFSTVYQTRHAVFAYGQYMESFIWNHIAWVDVDDDMQAIDAIITAGENFLLSRGRVPCFYTSTMTRPVHFEQVLAERKYAYKDHELWMFFPKISSPQPPVESRADLSISRVTTPEVLSFFLQILEVCFPGYSTAVAQEVRLFQPHKLVQHFITYLEGEVAGIGSIYSSEGQAIIHNMGTLPHLRRRGVATAILHRLINEAETLGISQLFLQCAADTPEEYLYRQFGFEVWFERKGWVREL